MSNMTSTSTRSTNSKSLSATLKIRPAIPSDFTGMDRQGIRRYLYGKIYLVSYDGKKFFFKTFRNSPVAREEFTERYNLGQVYVVQYDDESEMFAADVGRAGFRS